MDNEEDDQMLRVVCSTQIVACGSVTPNKCQKTAEFVSFLELSWKDKDSMVDHVEYRPTYKNLAFETGINILRTAANGGKLRTRLRSFMTVVPRGSIQFSYNSRRLDVKAEQDANQFIHEMMNELEIDSYQNLEK